MQEPQQSTHIIVRRKRLMARVALVVVAVYVRIVNDYLLILRLFVAEYAFGVCWGRGQYP